MHRYLLSGSDDKLVFISIYYHFQNAFFKVENEIENILLRKNPSGNSVTYINDSCPCLYVHNHLIAYALQNSFNLMR